MVLFCATENKLYVLNNLPYEIRRQFVYTLRSGGSLYLLIYTLRSGGSLYLLIYTLRPGDSLLHANIHSDIKSQCVPKAC